MKRIVLMLVVLLLATNALWSQLQRGSGFPIIGSQAPSFKAESTNGKISFPEDFGKDWKIIFSHPRDFTPVCSSELLELAYLQEEFDKLGVRLIVVSTDKLSQHENWKDALETLEYKGMEPHKINFPIVSDDHYIISKKYGMLQSPDRPYEDVRGVYIIDPDNTVQAIYFYPVNVGRNMDEIKRTVAALQTAKENIATPANWVPGDDVLLTFLSDYDRSEMNMNTTGNVYELTWFMIFKKVPTLSYKN